MRSLPSFRDLLRQTALNLAIGLACFAVSTTAVAVVFALARVGS